MTDVRSEFSFINWIRSLTPAYPGVQIGIGDDAGLFRFGDAGECLITTDMLMDGVDFWLHELEPAVVGRKALAVSLSDIAAMAGRPLAAVIAVSLPKEGGRHLAERIHAGVSALAAEFQVAVIGGDTNSWDGPLVICSTVLGSPTGRGPVRRNGAQAGDWIMVTGDLGGSILQKHLAFRPRVQEALAIHKAVELHAMIDISDGLAADLHHLLDESGVGATIRAANLPISEAALRIDDLRSPVEHALGDGEDFELLFTVSPEDGGRCRAPALRRPTVAHRRDHGRPLLHARRDRRPERSSGTAGLGPLARRRPTVKILQVTPCIAATWLARTR